MPTGPHSRRASAWSTCPRRGTRDARRHLPAMRWRAIAPAEAQRRTTALARERARPTWGESRPCAWQSARRVSGKEITPDATKTRSLSPQAVRARRRPPARDDDRSEWNGAPRRCREVLAVRCGAVDERALNAEGAGVAIGGDRRPCRPRERGADYVRAGPQHRTRRPRRDDAPSHGAAERSSPRPAQPRGEELRNGQGPAPI